MNTPKCPACGRVMTRYGHSASGAQRWRCSLCNISQVSRINSMAKYLDEFVAWLLGRHRQVDVPGGGRSFRRRCEPLWQLWPLSPIIDEVHEVIFVDGIHLSRGAVVLIAQTPDCVLGWYAARSENSRAWEALMSPITPPALVLTDGGSGFATACTKVWPTTRVQRCTFHAYCRIRQYTTTRPKLEASQHLYALGQQLLHVEGREDAQEWIGAYQGWCTRWKGFLEEKTRRPEGGGNTPTNVSCGLVTASTSSSGKVCCSRTWTPPGHARCPQQPTRSKARTRAYVRCCATTAPWA